MSCSIKWSASLELMLSTWSLLVIAKAAVGSWSWTGWFKVGRTLTPVPLLWLETLLVNLDWAEYEDDDEAEIAAELENLLTAEAFSKLANWSGGGTGEMEPPFGGLGATKSINFHNFSHGTSKLNMQALLSIRKQHSVVLEFSLYIAENVFVLIFISACVIQCSCVFFCRVKGIVWLVLYWVSCNSVISTIANIVRNGIKKHH